MRGKTVLHRSHYAPRGERGRKYVDASWASLDPFVLDTSTSPAALGVPVVIHGAEEVMHGVPDGGY